MKQIFPIILFTIFSIAVFGADTSNFSWRKLSHSDSSFFVPADWKEKSNKTEFLDVYLFSPTISDKDFEHEVGLRIMIYKGLKKQTGQAPSATARDIEAWVTNAYKGKMIHHGVRDIGPFHGSVAIFESRNGSRKHHEMHLGNDEKDCLWILTFTSPQADWEANWNEIGNTIFKNLKIDDEY
jgi:hypothetical protein